MSKKVGKVSQIIGPVVDVSFDTTSTELPKIYDSLEISNDDGSGAGSSHFLHYKIKVSK